MTGSYLDTPADQNLLRSWLFTRDHKRIAVMFFVATTLALLFGGVFALLLRLELLTPREGLFGATTYNRIFTLHGVTMVWLFMIPAIPTVFGNFLLPLMIGAQDVAFPRLNLASFYIYVFGAVVTLGGMFWGGADTGWTFYVPYSAQSATAVVPILVGVFILGWSSIITGLNFITTIHTMRAEHLSWHELPLFVWAIYATSIVQVLATPVLGLSLALVGLDAGLDLGLFDPARGGDPVLYQHLFWFYSHPAVYIMVLPAMGVVSECVCTFAHKRPLSYKAIAYSTIGIALVGFLAWGHHMFTAGMSAFNAGAFGVLSMLVSIFSAIKVFTWVGTLYRGSIEIRTPLVYVTGFLFLFMFGGMSGVAVATMSLDVHWHDTYFIVAHFHFIMVGGTLTAFLAAVHYWFPKMTGRRYPEKLAVLAALGTIGGFIVTFTPQFLLGNGGMLRRSAFYAQRYHELNVVSTLGSWLLGASLLLSLGYLLWALRSGPQASANIWKSASFEWRIASPPATQNFSDAPSFAHGAYDYTAPVPSTEEGQS